MDIERIKRMAMNAGANKGDSFVGISGDCLGKVYGHFMDDESLARFTRAVAEECAKVCDRAEHRPAAFNLPSMMAQFIRDEFKAKD